MKASYIKNKFFETLDFMNSNRSAFVKNPGKDFTRNRKCSFEALLLLIISMETHSMTREIREFFQGCLHKTPSKSAIVQQRDKLNDEAFPYLFRTLNENFCFNKIFRGYHLLACDGSDLNIPPMNDDPDTYVKSNTDGVGYYQMHLNVMYDVLEERYVDAIIQPRAHIDEREAFIEFLHRNPMKGKCLYTADRGFFSYNVLGHLIASKQSFLIRIKSPDSNNSFLKRFGLPDDDEFDINISFSVTRSHKKQYKDYPEKFVIIRSSRPFDFIDVDDKETVFPMSFRLTKIKTGDLGYEYLVSNLNTEDFNIEALKNLYSLRWGVETSFRFLKYNIALNCLHSKRRDFITQEIYARLILYNLTMLLVHNVSLPRKQRKYKYKISVSDAVVTCRYYLLNKIKNTDIEALLLRYLTAIRPNRAFPRKSRSKRFVPLINRA